MAKGRQSTKDTVVVMEPTEMDVLCSKDKSVAKHPGNVIFRERIEKGTAQYSVATSKQEKMKITRDIVTVMQVKYGARFLKQKGSGWVEINNQTARDKVSHALRFAAKNLGSAPTKKTQKKKPRNRSITSESSDSSTNSSHSSDASLSMIAEDEFAPEPFENIPHDIIPLNSIYTRQQNILTSMQKSADGYIDFQEFQCMSLSGMPTCEFNTLRSEDLNDLLREPMFSSYEEWEAVEQMAEC